MTEAENQAPSTLETHGYKPGSQRPRVEPHSCLTWRHYLLAAGLIVGSFVTGRLSAPQPINQAIEDPNAPEVTETYISTRGPIYLRPVCDVKLNTTRITPIALSVDIREDYKPDSNGGLVFMKKQLNERDYILPFSPLRFDVERETLPNILALFDSDNRAGFEAAIARTPRYFDPNLPGQFNSATDIGEILGSIRFTSPPCPTNRP